MTDNNKNLLAELGKRGVYQAIGIYVAVSWGSIEILITASDRFGWSAWLGDAALILFLTALPFVILLSWAFDLTGSGIKRMEPGSLTGKALIAGTLTVILGLSASWFVLRDDAYPGRYATEPGDRPVIAILPFVDQSEAPNGELAALRFTDEVINRINAHPDLVALDMETVTNPMIGSLVNDAGAATAVMDFLVRGTLRPAASGTELQVRMTDDSGLVTWQYETVLDLDDQSGLRDMQKFLAGEIAVGLGRSLTGIDYCEPSEDSRAVELYYEARIRYEQRGPVNVAAAARMLEEVIERDPRFARALDLLSSVYQRFRFHVLPDPSTYDMTRSEMIEFLDSQPYLPMAERALSLCPSLASSYVTIQTSVPAPQTFADGVEISLEGLERDPANLDLRSKLVGYFLAMGQIQSAGAIGREMHLRDPLNPRNSHILSWIKRLEGDFEAALELERKAVELGYVKRNAFPGIAYDLLILKRAEELEAFIGPDWEPGPLAQVNPLRILEAKTDVELKAQLITEYQQLIEAADLVGTRRLIGQSASFIFELGDEELALQAVDHFASFDNPGATPWIVWHSRYRHWFGERLMKYSVWVPEWADFWTRLGPPDGCAWDGEQLDCKWQ